MLVLIALLALAAVPLLPAICSSIFPVTHEGFRYPMLATLFTEAVAHGHLYPRWLPDLSGGNGYPTFIFYQPLFFFVCVPFLLLPGVGAGVAVHLACYVFLLSGVAGVYVLGRLFAGRSASLALAALFMVTPFTFVNLYVRGDLTELAAMMLTPWPLVGLIVAERRFAVGRPVVMPLLATAFALAMIVYAHPTIAMLYNLVPFVLATARVGFLPAGLRWRWLALLGTTGLLALAISSAYWFPVLQCRQYVHLDRALSQDFHPVEHLVDLGQLFSTGWSFGHSRPAYIGEPDAMPMTLGIVHVALAVAGLVLGWRRPWIRATAGAYLMLIIAVTPLAKSLWQLEPSPLRVVQFPWRLLSVIPVFGLLLTVTAFETLSRRLHWITPWACVLLAACLHRSMFATSGETIEMSSVKHTYTWNEADFAIAGFRRELPLQMVQLALVDEFAPIWRRDESPSLRANQAMAHALDPIEFSPTSTPYRLDLIVHAGPARSALLLRQYYFPGFHVEVNGETVPDATLRDVVMENGLMLVPVGPGDTHVVAWYAGPPGWRMRSVVSVVAVVVMTLLLRRIARRRVASSSPPDAASVRPGCAQA